MKKYEFMESEEFKALETSEQYIDYFICVKQDLLRNVDAVNWSIANCKLRYEQCKAKTLLNTDFKELYGKDNESIRKAHIQKEYGDIIQQLETYKNNKSFYENQLCVVDDILEANLIILSNHCGCDCDGC